MTEIMNMVVKKTAIQTALKAVTRFSPDTPKEVCMRLSIGGMSAEAMDSNSVSCICVRVPKPVFDTFTVQEATTLTMGTDIIKTILDFTETNKKSETVGLKVTDKSLILKDGRLKKTISRTNGINDREPTTNIEKMMDKWVSDLKTVMATKSDGLLHCVNAVHTMCIQNMNYGTPRIDIAFTGNTYTLRARLESDEITCYMDGAAREESNPDRKVSVNVKNLVAALKVMGRCSKDIVIRSTDNAKPVVLATTENAPCDEFGTDISAWFLMAPLTVDD